MKTRTFFITILLVTVVTVVIAGGSKKKLSTEESLNIIAGTWINDEYSESFKDYKFIIQPDGTYTGFTTVSSGMSYQGKYTIIDSMIDSDGNIWMKVRDDLDVEAIMEYEIWKFSDANATWELFFSPKEGWYGEGIPTDLETGDHARYAYNLYYRQ